MIKTKHHDMRASTWRSLGGQRELSKKVKRRSETGRQACRDWGRVFQVEGTASEGSPMTGVSVGVLGKEAGQSGREGAVTWGGDMVCHALGPVTL